MRCVRYGLPGGRRCAPGASRREVVTGGIPRGRWGFGHSVSLSSVGPGWPEGRQAGSQPASQPGAWRGVSGSCTMRGWARLPEAIAPH